MWEIMFQKHTATYIGLGMLEILTEMRFLKDFLYWKGYRNNFILNYFFRKGTGIPLSNSDGTGRGQRYMQNIEDWYGDANSLSSPLHCQPYT